MCSFGLPDVHTFFRILWIFSQDYYKMNKKCAKCSKTVYPIEELKCLDKTWHKMCFKCETCGMTLNMKNYKGYNKVPYCNAHYPSTKHTQVADTPESRRIAENTKIQSSVQYHADFERQKGQKTSVADDPETARIRQNTAIQSNVNYWGVREQREQMEHRRPNEMVDDVTGQRIQPGSIADYDPMNDQHSSVVRTGYGPPQPQPIPVAQSVMPGGPDPRGYAPPPQQPQPARASNPPPVAKTPAYRAIYDYTAADDDEVSFSEGDMIINTQIIDDGWMTGTVQRNGAHGMLPSNYVERV